MTDSGGTTFFNMQPFSVFLISLCCSLVLGYPSGAPSMICVSMSPSHGVSAQTGPSGHSVTASTSTYSAGSDITVSISGSFKGVLLQARRSDGSSTTPIGSFSSPSSDTKILTCSSTSDSVTHSSATVKSAFSVTWTAPTSDFGTIYFRATVVEAKLTYWVEQLSSTISFTAACSLSCQNGGVCTAGSPETCDCAGTGFSGTLCETSVCSLSCQNGGVCTTGSPETCDCAGTGFSGTLCETSVCSLSCENGGSCVSGSPDMCDCSGTNFIGTLCGTSICSLSCQNGGSCVSGSPDSCDCSGTNFSGTFCETSICSLSCQNGGSCVSGSPDSCDCSGTNFSGTLCETTMCSLSCQNSGSCVLGSPDSCDCSGTNFNGTLCEASVCTLSCQNGGICVPEFPNKCDCSGTMFNGALCDSEIRSDAVSQQVTSWNLIFSSTCALIFLVISME